MHNSSSQAWHEAFASVDFSVRKPVLSSAAFGCAGMFALALSASHFLPRPSAGSDFVPAYSASQPASGESLETDPVVTTRPRA
ncbi:MAG TPA: hypothetical protein VF797_13055, partial [Noviherbaspirillum sp.]